MPSTQENKRLQNFEQNLSRASDLSESLVNSMSRALSSFQRDKQMIINRITDDNLTDADYLHNGASSPTIGEIKQALRGIVSYTYHQGSLTQTEAEGLLSEAGMSETTLLSTEKIANALEPLRV